MLKAFKIDTPQIFFMAINRKDSKSVLYNPGYTNYMYTL